MTLTKTHICALFLASALAALPLGSAFAAMATDSKGMTLYVFDKDKGKTSNCYDECAVHWPPFLVQAGEKKDKDWGHTKRKDGSMQWTYDGHPTYFFMDDKAPGDMKGDGMGGVWHIIK